MNTAKSMKYYLQDVNSDILKNQCNQDNYPLCIGTLVCFITVTVVYCQGALQQTWKHLHYRPKHKNWYFGIK